MKLTKVVVALAIAALTLAGCYWTPPQARSGGVSLNLTLPRGVSPAGYAGWAFRVYLYDAGDVSALYGFPPASSQTPASRTDYIEIKTTGSPIGIDGYDHFDLTLDPFYNIGPSGSFTIPDILPGRKYRMHVQYGYYDPPPYLYGNYEGLSEAFVVAPGGVVDVALDLYYNYNGYNP